ncbi:MAG: F0F1 ATP synthase subunit epsilon [Candidatus Adlerbacteria bacterium]
MHLTIATVTENLFDGEAVSVTVPGTAGEMTVLTHHEPIITTLKKGTIIVRELNDIEPREFPIESGVLEVRSDGATILL